VPEQFVALVRRWLGCRVSFEACMNWHRLLEILGKVMPLADIVLPSAFKTQIKTDEQLVHHRLCRFRSLHLH
jgi:hypothetical protein